MCCLEEIYIYMFAIVICLSVVNVYLHHMKFCVVCINGRRYVCCGECYVVSNECDEPTSCHVQPIVVKLCNLGVLALGVSLVSCICMFVVNTQFELLEFVFDSVYVDPQYDEIYLTFTAGSVCLCGGCSTVVVLCLSVRLSWYPMLWVRLLR